MQTIKATVRVDRLEPGDHISRRVVERDIAPPQSYDIPADECRECRPDWGEYSPIFTLPALERALRSRGVFDSYHGPDASFSYGFDK